MSQSRAMVLGVGVLTACVLAPSAWATMADLKAYKEAHPGLEAKAYSCKVCHLNAVGKKGELNPYGQALEKQLAATGAKALTVEDIQAVDKASAEKEGAAKP